MDDAKTYAWILYSLSGASRTGPSNFADISQIADAINHAVPTHKELQSSLKWLVANGMVEKKGTRYQLTLVGSDVLASASNGNQSISEVWDKLAITLAELTK